MESECIPRGLATGKINTGCVLLPATFKQLIKCSETTPFTYFKHPYIGMWKHIILDARKRCEEVKEV